MLPVGGDGDEGDELAGDLVDDDVAGVFAAGLAGDDGGGRDADEGGGEGGEDGTDELGAWVGCARWMRANHRRAPRLEP